MFGFVPAPFYPRPAPYYYQTVQPAPPKPPLAPFKGISLDLPSFSYSPQKIAAVPFDKRYCNDGRFRTMQEAFEFVARHCLRFHGEITKSLIKLYLPLVEVYDQVNGNYSPASRIGRRDFDIEFKKISSLTII